MKSHKRKNILLLLLILALCVCVCTLVACHNSNGTTPEKPNPPTKDPTGTTQQHTHNYILSSTIPATCTEKGSNIYVCACGSGYTDPIPALGHDLIYVSSDDGETHCKMCRRCDYKTEKEAHSYDNIVDVRHATCTEEGLQTATCECGASVSQILSKLDHKFNVYKYDDGEHWRVCEMCLMPQPNSRVSHSFDTQKSFNAATCTEQGSMVMQCRCGATEETILPVVPHDFQYNHNDTEHWKQCSSCTLEQKGSRAAHNMQLSSQSATCVKDGVTVTFCDCGLSQTETTPALGHNTDKSVFAYRNDEGHFYSCKRCGETVKEQHTLEDADCPDGRNKAPACSVQGHQDKKCSVCGYTFHTTIPAAGHKYKYDETTRKEPTCTQKGSVEKVCSVCGDRQTETIPTIDHIWAKAWQSDDSSHWHTCTVCGAKQSAAGHSYVTQDSKAATCLTEGYTKEKCSECEHIRTTVLPKGEHNYQLDPVDYRDATCTEQGYHWYECSVCHDRKKEYEDLLPHNIVSVSAKAATETEKGWVEHFACTFCGKKFKTQTDQFPLTDEDVYLPALTPMELRSIAELKNVAKDFLDVPSIEKYQISASVFMIQDNAIWLTDDSDDIIFTVNDTKYALNTINEGDIVTLKGCLLGTSDGADLVDLEIVSVDDGKPNTVTVTADMTFEAQPDKFYAHSSSAYYTFVNYISVTQSCYYDQPILGETLHFEYVDYSGVLIGSFVINGKSYTMHNGSLDYEVKGDVNIQVTFAEYPLNIVSVEEIVTTPSGVDVEVDPYITYRYDGNANTYGRLYANSHLRFTVTNAYITRIEIEFEEFNQNDKLKNNLIYLGSDLNHKAQVAYKLDGLKVVLNFDVAKKYAFFEYSAVAQARIKTLIIQYETYNT